MSERRRYFKVADSIAHEQWSNDELATIIRLMAHLHERWARDGLTPEQACACELGPTQYMHLTRRYRPAYARLALSKLAAVATMSIEYRDDIAVIKWPKFAEFQALPSRERGSEPPAAVPPKTQTHTQTDTREEKKPTASAVGKEKRARSRRAPRDFVPDPVATQKIAAEKNLAPAFVAERLASFRDHEFRDPHSDWQATWRNWLRDARGFTRVRQLPLRSTIEQGTELARQKGLLP